MNEMKIALREHRNDFRPGDEITGAAGWKINGPVKSAEVRLFWHTRGKGTEDVRVVEVVEFEAPQSEEARPFRFVAPAGPHSFSGALTSLLWAVELVVNPGNQSARAELTLSPTGREILLK